MADFLAWHQASKDFLEIIQLDKEKGLVLVQLKKPLFLYELASQPWLEFIDRGLQKPVEEAEIDPTGFRVNRVSATYGAFPALNGAGLAVSIKERAFDPEDIDFRGRIGNPEAFPGEITTHATTMASLIGGGGNSSLLGRGVAWQAELLSASFENLMPDDATLLTAQGVSVQNHSYGVAIENYYGLETQAYDKQVWENPHLMHVFSSGNSGNLSSESGIYAGISGFANLTAQFKMSKNTLSIGEIDAQKVITPLSSRGPAYDGRIKPELTAYGAFGSSESAALVSGVCLLVQQAYQDKFKQLPSSALVKAALINSAEDLGRPEVDFEYGFGSVNALGAIKSIAEERFIQDHITQNENRSYTIQVPPGTQKLKISLVWNDPEAIPNAPRALINDLDLELTDLKSGEIWLPWVLNHFPHPDSLTKPAQRKADHLNNVEQITLAHPDPGVYQISIKGLTISTTSQDFFVVYEFENEPFWVYPHREDYIRGGRAYTLEWKKNALSGVSKLEYKYSNSQDWQLISEITNPHQEQFTWEFPDTLALPELRLVENDGTIQSTPITVNRPIVPQVGFDCEEEILLFWSPVPGISEYQVFYLGERYLEPLSRVTDTLLVIAKNRQKGLHFAVAPVFEEITPKGLTIDYTFQARDCYFKSVLLRDFISAKDIMLDVNLGTTYGLVKITLQRFENGDFRDISSIHPPPNPSFSLVDDRPITFKNTYRVLLTDDQGRQWYSNELDAFFVPENNFFIYPNPVKRDDIVILLDAEEQISQLEIIQLNGNVVKSFAFQSGTSKEIPMDVLTPGLYFLKMKTSRGQTLVKKLLIE